MLNNLLQIAPNNIPYWRLSAFYFYYFALLGSLLPFWGLYLQDRGFGLSEIGSLMALLMGTKLFAPNLWGWIADRSGHRLRIIRFGALIAFVLFIGIRWADSFLSMAVVMIGFSFFWNAILPQFEVLTLRTLGKETRWYSRIRLWGSAGFVVLVLGLGAYFENHDISHLPMVISALLLLIAISSFMVSEKSLTRSPKGGFKSFLRQLFTRPVMVFFGICFLMQLSHGPYYSFYSIYLESHEYSKTTIGWLWSWGVIAEIGVFIGAHWLFNRFTDRTLLIACLAITTLRWWLIGAFPDHHGLLFLAQLGHGASFGLFHALAIHSVHRFFDGPSAGQGQGMYSAFTFGAGSALGAYSSGIIVEGWGTPIAFYLAAGVTTAATLICMLFTENHESK